MKLDAWMLSLGMAAVENLEPAARAALVVNAENALRAGVSISLREWTELGDESRAAFLIAADRLRAVEAYMIGSACRSKMDALAILSKADDGDAYVREMLEKTSQIAADTIEKSRPMNLGAAQ